MESGVFSLESRDWVLSSMPTNGQRSSKTCSVAEIQKASAFYKKLFAKESLDLSSNKNFLINKDRSFLLKKSVPSSIWQVGTSNWEHGELSSKFLEELPSRESRVRKLHSPD